MGLWAISARHGWHSLCTAATWTHACAALSAYHEWLLAWPAACKSIDLELCGRFCTISSVCHYARLGFARRRGQPVACYAACLQVPKHCSEFHLNRSLTAAEFVNFRLLTALPAGRAHLVRCTQTDQGCSTLHTCTPAAAMPRSSGLVLALAASAAALSDSRVTPCPLYTPKITLNQPPRVATLAMG